MRPLPLAAVPPTTLHLLMKLHLLLSSCLLASSCASTAYDSKLQTWGELRSVLRDGETQGRVALTQAARPGTYGLGAIAGLHGELLVADGVVWVSCATAPDAVEPARPPIAGEQATLLALATVAEWETSELRDISDVTALERAVRAAAEAAGLDPTQPFPFVVDGTVTALDLHVLNGACPFASPAPPPERAPYRSELERTDVMLVGFHAEGMAGKLTHHGSSSHIHVLTGGSPAVVGHVDDLQLLDGAQLRVPRR